MLAVGRVSTLGVVARRRRELPQLSRRQRAFKEIHARIVDPGIGRAGPLTATAWMAGSRLAVRVAAAGLSGLTAWLRRRVTGGVGLGSGAQRPAVVGIQRATLVEVVRGKQQTLAVRVEIGTGGTTLPGADHLQPGAAQVHNVGLVVRLAHRVRQKRDLLTVGREVGFTRAIEAHLLEGQLPHIAEPAPLFVAGLRADHRHQQENHGTSQRTGVTPFPC